MHSDLGLTLLKNELEEKSRTHIMINLGELKHLLCEVPNPQGLRSGRLVCKNRGPKIECLAIMAEIFWV